MADKETTKDLQDKLVANMRHWQKIEDAAVTSTGRIIEKTDNALIRMVMEIIQHDSKLHFRVQEAIAASLESKAVTLTPDDLSEVWDAIEKHIKIEKDMVKFVEETLGAIKGKKMLVQEYLLEYLKTDERKHDALLEALEGVKKGLYPYA